MNDKAIMIVGLGSMGRRRITLLKKICPQAFLVGVDADQKRCEDVERNFGITTFQDIQEAADRYSIEAALVCTSPLTHAAIIELLLSKQIHVFTELNLVDTLYDKNIETAERNDLILFLSSTMLYRGETQYIQEYVKNLKESANYIYHVGQYLPTWHPWENYKDFFVGDKRTNGCREIFAIELPWLLSAFGDVTELTVTSGNMTDLKLDYPDYYIVTVKHENGALGSLSFNVASRNAVRHFELYGPSSYIKWDGTPDSLQAMDQETLQISSVDLTGNQFMKDSSYNKSISEDAYYNELTSFFRVLETKQNDCYSFREDKRTLEIIDLIEKEAF